MSIPTRGRLFLGLVAGAWLIVSARLWALGETFYLRDFWTNYVPARIALREAFAAGRWPLWNQWINGGLPAGPDPASSLFYFPAWPMLVPGDQAWALSLLVSAHLLVAALGTWLLARRQMAQAGACAAAVVFAFGGLLISNQINAQFQYAYCLMPAWWWALFGLLDATEASRRWQFGGALGALWALQLLAPDPQTAYLEGLCAAVALLATPARAEVGRASWRRWLVLASAVVLAIVLAAPQLAAFLEALGQTQRGGFTDAEATTWSLAPSRLWELILPLPFGRLTPVTTFWGGALVGRTWSNFYFASLYVGALTLPLALLGLARLERRARVLAVGSVVLVLGAMGTILPLYNLARQVLPVWSAFRYPERLVATPLLGLAILVGLGIDRVTRAEAPRWVAALLVFPVGVLAVWWWPTLLGSGPVSADAVTVSVAPSVVHALAVLALGGLATFAPAAHRGPALLVVMTLDLLVAAQKTQATWVPPPLRPLPVATPGRLLMPLRDLASAVEGLPPEPAQRRAFEDLLGRPNLNAIRGQRTTNGVSSLDLRRAAALRRELGPEAAALLYETDVFIGRPDLPLKSFTRERELARGLVLYRATKQPRPVWCTSRWVPVPSLQDAVGVVGRHEVPVETSQPPDPSGAGELPCQLSRPESGTLIVDLEPQRWPVLVSPSESFYPGWEVRFDGGPWSAALPSQVAFVGAIAPPSTARVEFRFVPAWFAPSLGLAMVGWVVWGLVWARLALLRRSRRVSALGRVSQ